MSGEESSKLDEQAFLKLPVIGALLVPSVPSSNGGAATESAKADRA